MKIYFVKIFIFKYISYSVLINFQFDKTFIVQFKHFYLLTLSFDKFKVKGNIDLVSSDPPFDLISHIYPSILCIS